MKEKTCSINNFLNVCQSTKNLSDRTIKAYKSDLSDFSSYLTQNKYNKDIILNYIHHLSAERKLKDNTIKRKLTVLKMYFEYLYKYKYIDQNFYQSYTFRFKGEKRLPKTLSVSDINQLIHFLTRQTHEVTSQNDIWKSSRNLALLDLLVSTGIRIGEASEITVSEISIPDKMILVHGKGRKQRLIYISCQQTWDNLMSWLNIRNSFRYNNDKLFVNRYGNPIGIHGIEYIYKSCISKAGLTGHSTPHYLRHTFATNLLANGADLRSVQEILGHANVSTTEIYTEVSANRKKEVMDNYNYRNRL